jgi:hypothetical protein
LNFFPQRKCALQHFAATQAPNIKIKAQITIITEQVLELSVAEGSEPDKIYNLGTDTHHMSKVREGYCTQILLVHFAVNPSVPFLYLRCNSFFVA